MDNSVLDAIPTFPSDLTHCYITGLSVEGVLLKSTLMNGT